MHAHAHGYRLGRGRMLQTLVHTSTAILACVAVIVAAVAGTGWLYLLRDLHVLAFGPTFRGALPLQQLAGGAAQPLGRMVVAWLPAGLALGVALGQLMRGPRPVRALAAAAGSAALLLAASAVSDAVTQNDSVRAHVSASFSRGGVWLAVGLLGLGALVARSPS